MIVDIWHLPRQLEGIRHQKFCIPYPRKAHSHSGRYLRTRYDLQGLLIDAKGNTGVMSEMNELRKTKTQLVSLNIQSAKDSKAPTTEGGERLPGVTDQHDGLLQLVMLSTVYTMLVYLKNSTKSQFPPLFC